MANCAIFQGEHGWQEVKVVKLFLCCAMWHARRGDARVKLFCVYFGTFREQQMVLFPEENMMINVLLRRFEKYWQPPGALYSAKSLPGGVGVGGSRCISGVHAPVEAMTE